MSLKHGVHGYPIIDQLCEDGFVDLTFQITNLVEDRKSYRFHLAASYKKQELGFDVALVKGIQGGFDSDMNLVQDHVYRKGVRFIRSGAESDRLISTIGRLYEIEPMPAKMVAEETFTAIALHQGELDFSTECVKLKLFGRDGEPFLVDDYYESFFNVDLGNRLVYWNEKDPDYREPLIRALGSE